MNRFIIILISTFFNSVFTIAAAGLLGIGVWALYTFLPLWIVISGVFLTWFLIEIERYKV